MLHLTNLKFNTSGLDGSYDGILYFKSIPAPHQRRLARNTALAFSISLIPPQCASFPFLGQTPLITHWFGGVMPQE